MVPELQPEAGFSDDADEHRPLPRTSRCLFTVDSVLRTAATGQLRTCTASAHFLLILRRSCGLSKLQTVLRPTTTFPQDFAPRTQCHCYVTSCGWTRTSERRRCKKCSPRER